MAQEDVFKKIVSHCKEYGFVFPSSDIYDGLAAVYDYGQNGVELKNNIKQYWWQSMVLLHSNIVGIDASIFMHPTVWKASGHVDAFNDPLIDNRDSKKRYRADNLIEDQIGKYEEKIAKEVPKAAKKFGDSFDEAKFRETNPRVLENQKKRDELHARYTEAMQGPDLEALKQIILDEGITDPLSGTKNWTDVRQFNLMFSTEVGASAEATNKIYLRPETAQGIFVNFLNVQKTGRMKLPFGICQIGKAFRNEIVARQFVFRMREFEQMEMQFFCQPGTEMKWFEYWKKHRLAWHEALGMGDENYRFHDHEKLAHYANAATDIEFHMPFGFKEVEGIHSRTDFDLSQHEKFSGRQIKYFDPERNESYTPYDVETSIGVDRMFLSVMCHRRAAGERFEPCRTEAAGAAGTCQVCRTPAGQQGRTAGEGAGNREQPEVPLQHPHGSQGLHRQALPPAGCHRYAVLRDGRRRHAERQHRDAALPRLHETRACVGREAARHYRGPRFDYLSAEED